MPLTDGYRRYSVHNTHPEGPHSMNDPRQYNTRETLRNGLEVCIRAARPSDLERVINAFNELDPESIYFRYFGPKKSFSDADIHQFINTDFKNRVTLLCTLMRDGSEIVIASATYVRIDDKSAEVAFLVEEDYHRLGIAGRMIRHLGGIASADGIETFVAEVLPDNKAMLGVFKVCGYPTRSHTEDGTVHVALAIAATPKA
jgi:RimJ/RimL family protein N-acetyltransferase